MSKIAALYARELHDARFPGVSCSPECAFIVSATEILDKALAAERAECVAAIEAIPVVVTTEPPAVGEIAQTLARLTRDACADAIKRRTA